MIEFILSLCAVALCGYLGFKGDRWAGNARKTLGWATLGLAISIPTWLGLIFTWDLLSHGFIVSICALIVTYGLACIASNMLRRWFLWGATFMNDWQGEKEEKHLYVYSIAEKICGFKWGELPSDKLAVLKMTMWMVHHAIAGSLCAVMIAVSNLTVLPLVMVVLVGLLRSYIYRRAHLTNAQTQTEVGEKEAGLMTYALMALSRI